MVAPQGPSRRRFSLRRFALVLSIVLISLTLLASISLKVFTNLNQRHLRAVVWAGDARHAADLTRVELMHFGRVASVILATGNGHREPGRASEIGKVYLQLDALRGFLEPSQLPALEKAREQIGAYFLAQHDAETRGANAGATVLAGAPSMDAALATLTELAQAEDARIRFEVERSNQWDRSADLAGWAVFVLVVLGSVAGLFGLYRLVLLPTIDLSDSIKRFGDGHTDARAELSGSDEIASAASTFNELADLITGQHARMLDFLASVAKELKQPVQIMRTALAQFLPGHPAATDDKLQARMAVVQREVDRLDLYIDGFLGASRIEWQRLDLQQPRQDVRTLVGDVVKIYETFSTVHQVSLTVPEQPVWVCFDERRMTQVLNMLLSNAIQFSPHGGLVTVSVVADVYAKEAILAVTDYGVVIQQEAMGTIFEPFHKVQNPRGHDQPRLGSVALSIAKRIVQAHGGRIEVESRAGEGTTFRLRLPLAPSAEEERRETKERGGMASGVPEPAGSH
jgi:two-component system, OmpR family, sensor histidine kinase MtrB